MTRRSTRLMRLENSLYTYNSQTEAWDIKEVHEDQINLTSTDLFEKGSYFTCKHMSQKTSPISIRLDNIDTWDSLWYSKYKAPSVASTKLNIDFIIRDYIENVLNSLNMLVNRIYIKELNQNYFVTINLYEIGTLSKKDTFVNLNRKKRFLDQGYSEVKQSGINPFYDTKNNFEKITYADIPKLLVYIEKQLHIYTKRPIHLSVIPVSNLGSSASLLGKFLVKELEKPNPSFKKALKNTLSKIKIKSKIRGLRVNCSGRLGRAPMAKLEWFKYGSIPLTKINSRIDYHYETGKTKYGSFGVKVWLYNY